MTAPRPHRRKLHDRLIAPGSTAEQIRCDMALAPFDQAARQSEATWGIDKLPGLVSPELAARYGAALAHLNACVDAADPEATAAAAANCIKGLAAMDAAARAAGHAPTVPTIWEVHLDYGGHRIGVILDERDWPQAHRARPDLTIHSLRELAVAKFPPPEPTPPPQFTQPIQLSALAAELDDEIPF